MQTLDPALEQKLIALRDAVLLENEKINLTALRTPEACWIGNVLDSVSFLTILSKIGTPKTLLDVGTGGGFPLLPLAIALPETICTGLDSTKKKIDAVQRIADAVGIGNVRLVSARSELAAHDKAHREQYDCVTARAVAALSVLLEYTVPFAKVNGHIVLWKSMHAEQEIEESEAAQRLLKCPLSFRQTYALPGDFGERQLLVFKKNAPTPKAYPREVGLPGKLPLR